MTAAAINRYLLPRPTSAANLPPALPRLSEFSSVFLFFRLVWMFRILFLCVLPASGILSVIFDFSF